MSTEFASGAKRAGRKPVYHLVPVELMEAVADTRAEGDQKYGAGNWKQGDREFFVDCLGHAIEHLMECAWDDQESTQTHLGHAATNIGFILWAMKRGKVTREDFQRAALIVGHSTPSTDPKPSSTSPSTQLSPDLIELYSTILASAAAATR